MDAFESDMDVDTIRDDVGGPGRGGGGGGGGGGEGGGEDECKGNFDVIYKVLVIGDSNVGKTALLTRFCESRFQSSFMSTVGIDYKSKVISLDTEKIKLQIWDTAGQERFRTLTNAYFRGAAGAILLYDVTNRTTFDNVAGWMDSIVEHGSPNIRVVVVGHKCDLTDERCVSAHEGNQLAKSYESLFYEASSKSAKNCTKIFLKLAQEIKLSQEEACYMKQTGSHSQMLNGHYTLPTDTVHEYASKSNCRC